MRARDTMPKHADAVFWTLKSYAAAGDWAHAWIEATRFVETCGRDPRAAEVAEDQESLRVEAHGPGAGTAVAGRGGRGGTVTCSDYMRSSSGMNANIERRTSNTEHRSAGGPRPGAAAGLRVRSLRRWMLDVSAAADSTFVSDLSSRWRSRAAAILALCLLASPLLGAPSPPPSPTVCVLDFLNATAADGDAGQWSGLGKGLSDLLTADIAERCRPVTRERLTLAMTELALSSGGLTSDNGVAVARFLRVQFVIGGNYEVTAGELRLTAWLIDAKTGALKRVTAAKGGADDAMKIVRSVSHSIFSLLEIPVSREELDLLRTLPRMSIDALKAHSLALASYDHGDLHRALALFRRAARGESPVPNAGFWAGQLFMDLGEVEHAVLEWNAIVSRCPDAPLTAEIHWNLAETYRRGLRRPEPAMREYETLCERFPRSSRTTKAYAHLGAYYQRKQDFPRAWRMFDAACERGGLAACWTYSGPLLRCDSMALNDGETNRISAAGLTGGYYGRCVYVERDGEPQVVKPGEHLIYIAPPGMVFESLEYTVDVEVKVADHPQVYAYVDFATQRGETRKSGKLSGRATFATAHNIIQRIPVGPEGRIGDITARFKLREGRDERPVGQIHVNAGRYPTLPTRPPVGDVIATQDRKGRYHIVFNEEAGRYSNSPGPDPEAELFLSSPTTHPVDAAAEAPRSTAPDRTPHRRSASANGEDLLPGRPDFEAGPERTGSSGDIEGVFRRYALDPIRREPRTGCGHSWWRSRTVRSRCSARAARSARSMAGSRRGPGGRV